MPNIVAHNHVANLVLRGPLPDEALGSVLPDFAGMYRDYHGERVGIRGINRQLDRGISFHYKTDRLFDAQLEKSLMTTGLTMELLSGDINPRAARLGAHLLADIMLDGILLERHEARRDYEDLAECVCEEETALHRKKFPPKFVDMVSGYFEKGIPERYSNPQMLSRIIKRRLDFRAARSSGADSMIGANQLPAVAEVIEANMETIRALGTVAIDRTVETLSEQRAPHWLRSIFRTS